MKTSLLSLLLAAVLSLAPLSAPLPAPPSEAALPPGEMPAAEAALPPGETLADETALPPTDPAATIETTTVLFYMIASDLESLQGRATEDFTDMLALPASHQLHLVFQTGGTARWQNDLLTGGQVERSVISGGSHSVVARPDAEMTAPGALSDFLRWGAAAYPADRYLLVLWDHGYGTLGGFGKDETAGDAALSLAQLRQELRGSGLRPDIIVFDACLMGTLETAYALRDCCDYMVASEELLPAQGLQYSDWLLPLSSQPGMDSYELATLIATAYQLRCGSYLGGNTGMAVISPAQAQAALAQWQSLLANFTPEEITLAASQCHEMGLRDGGFDQFDLGQLAQKLGADLAALTPCTGRLAPFRKNGSALTGFSGIAVYLPFRHKDKYGTVRESLLECGLPEDYITVLDNCTTGGMKP